MVVVFWSWKSLGPFNGIEVWYLSEKWGYEPSLCVIVDLTRQVIVTGMQVFPHNSPLQRIPLQGRKTVGRLFLCPSWKRLRIIIAGSYCLPVRNHRLSAFPMRYCTSYSSWSFSSNVWYRRELNVDFVPVCIWEITSWASIFGIRLLYTKQRHSSLNEKRRHFLGDKNDQQVSFTEPVPTRSPLAHTPIGCQSESTEVQRKRPNKHTSLFTY